MNFHKMKINFSKLKKVVIIFLAILGNSIFAQTPPNFVIVVLDDQGWTGTSVQMDGSIEDSKSDFYITASLESLALKGMTFSQGYAPAPKCSPSRDFFNRHFRGFRL